MNLFVLVLGKLVMVGDNPVTKDTEPSDEAPAIPIHAFLIDTPEGKILFDAGCHPEAMTGAWPKEMCTNPYVFSPEATIPNRLKEIGVELEDVKTLVVSHLHLDHAGCIHLFPNAKVYVQENELIETIDCYEKNNLDIFHLECDIKNWIETQTKWVTINAEKEVKLCDGVYILDLKKGHSFGMLGLYVELESGNLLLVSDAAYSAVHYGPPAELSGVVYDEEGYFAAIEYIRNFAEKHNAKVLFGHDMAQFKSLIKSSEGYYQ